MRPVAQPAKAEALKKEITQWLLLPSTARRAHSTAPQHLTEAKRITSQFGMSPMLTKIEAALAGLT